MPKEAPTPSNNDNSEPLYPAELPPDLADFLRGHEYGCLTHPTDKGTAFVIKAPEREIRSVRGRVPISVRHELYDHPLAPVIRMVMTIYDQPQSPLALEMYINVEDPQQRGEFAALATQQYLYLLFYDEQLRHRLNKQVPNAVGGDVARVVEAADKLHAAIPTDRFDFDRAKQEVMRATSL